MAIDLEDTDLIIKIELLIAKRIMKYPSARFWHPTHNWDDAMDIVENWVSAGKHMRFTLDWRNREFMNTGTGEYDHRDTPWWAAFTAFAKKGFDIKRHGEGLGATGPVAICEGILKVMGIENPKEEA